MTTLGLCLARAEASCGIMLVETCRAVKELGIGVIMGCSPSQRGGNKK